MNCNKILIGAVVLLYLACGKSEPDLGSNPMVIENEPPVAEASADIASGTLPLEVEFSGSGSSDDKSIVSYSWNFKDGSSATIANPKHTFTSAGTYEVELTVTDKEGLSDKDWVSITVDEPANEAPIAVVEANKVMGTAPFEVQFDGSGSTDDHGIERYLWRFKDGAESEEVNPTHTFETPGIYYVDLFVYDAQGLSTFAGVKITVEEGEISDAMCNTFGGKANETGLKTWCWSEIDVPSGETTGRDGFSNEQLALNTECNGNMITVVGNRLRFAINPTSPAPKAWCNSNYNFRSEIRTLPWNVDHPSGTEEWIGFSYSFGATYSADPTENWVFYQAHEGTVGATPLISLQINGVHTPSSKTGEILLVNAAHDGLNKIYATNTVPQAGDTVDVVLHIVWGDDTTGLLELWLNGVKTINLPVTRTVRSETGVGGNSKFGIYYAPWRNRSGIDNSAAAGISEIETFMGPLRIITRNAGDAEYRKKAYNEVSPR